MEVVLCSTSGKPIFHYKITLNDVLKASICKQQQEENDSRSVSFSCSLQGLVSFVSCMTQGEKIQEIQMEKSRCIFHLVDPITCVIIIREEKDKSAIQIIETTSLKRLLELLYAQILFILTDRGLDVLRKQPSYDLRELLIGTERTMRSLTNGWYRHVSLHMKDMGIRFLRMHPMDRMEITKAIEANTHTTKMICGILLANEQVVAIVQPNKKQFGILVDDLLLLINFVYNTPSFLKSETWMPICLPGFNQSGFLYAYVVFLTEEICLLLLSSKESPEQFHLFQNQKNIITNHLETLNAYAKIDFALYSFSQWRPHRDIDYLKHFIYKNELTCQCICPEEEKEEKEDEEKVYKQQVNLDRMQQYTRLHTQMISMSTTSNISTSQVLTKPLYMMNGSSILSKLMYLEEEANGLYMGIATEHDRLYAFFQVPSGLLTPVEAQQSCEVLLQLLRKDEQLVIPSTTLSTNAMGTSSFSSSFTSYSSWP